MQKTISREDQLQLKCNYIDENNNHLYLVKCIVCDTENWNVAVPLGQCVWCSWKDEHSPGIYLDNNRK